MVNKRNAQLASGTPVNENAIMDEVLEPRRGWNKGRGRKLFSGESSSQTTQSQGSQGQETFTRGEVTQLYKNQKKQNKFLKSIFNIMKSAGQKPPKVPQLEMPSISGLEEEEEEEEEEEDDDERVSLGDDNEDE